MTQDTTQSVLFPNLFHKPVVASFDQPDSSSDGGAIVLKAIDSELNLMERLASCLRETREEGKIVHSLLDLFRQRVYGIACGYPDCNDADRLADDPIQKLLLDRDPIDGKSLASQPTLSRFENAPSSKDLLKLGCELADIVIEHHAKRLRGKARLITIDLDPTDDPTHRAQQLTFFNAHYDAYCYLPMVGTLQFNNETEKYLFTVVLRPGNAPASKGAFGILMRFLTRLRDALPKTRFSVRLDGGFATPAILDYLELEGVEYLVGIAGNSRLEKRARRLMGKFRMKPRKTGKTDTLFSETRYAARKWSHRRRVIIKAEVVRCLDRDPRDNDRFVLTNLPYKPESVYRIYRGRGDAENRIKELHYGLEIDRTSCMSFLANQLRVFMTAAADVLMHEMRVRMAGTALAAAQVSTLRERLLKIAVWVKKSVRRIVLHFPVNYPWLDCWKQIVKNLATAT
ncbi:MAG: IS1380 family transposase [Acidobacteria bacterium]|nr:IS1380 family transposase [Acidobacteriota bacterium]